MLWPGEHFVCIPPGNLELFRGLGINIHKEHFLFLTVRMESFKGYDFT